MLVSFADYRQIVRELDHICKYSSPEKLGIVRILYDIKKTGLFVGDKKKLQKVINIALNAMVWWF